ncbi:CDP-6-deoxy-delta-3,4-glucoseen reductase [Thiorhodococcus minor]|uniref:CDP-6-deoxy-delta-3,4-glucoseen reductase n=1 Tax=Thiorhodococcus minor TaxID=57489 RepID=A0A6M0K038_9GAMM|nr:CDP-6-deoxy-delta-3,4-glucoseen reductase [Thiorhodococcus minor]NEV62303.1 CDP-6-deoxy-delta-3,4-glucoseen reductase [Thiorhodococcus minor]
MTVKIQLLPEGTTFEAEPGETILDAALRQGIGLPYGCRNGQCGSCAGHLVSGWIQYPSGLITALEGKKAGTCLTCQAVPTSDLVLEVAQRRVPAEIEIRTLPGRVERKEHLNHDVVRLLLKLPEQQRLQFLAGQYVELSLRDGRTRAFSIANAPHDDAFLELHIRQIAGGEVTRHIFEELAEKSILRIRGPLGDFYLREESQRPIIMVAGGTGFAPLKGMIEHAIEVGLKRPIHLYWGARSRRDLYFPDLPGQWAEKLPSFAFTPVLSEPDADWTGRTGWVHEAVLQDAGSLDAHEVYMAGPPAMIAAAETAFLAHGLDRNLLFADAFTYSRSPTGEAGDEA